MENRNNEKHLLISSSQIANPRETIWKMNYNIIPSQELGKKNFNGYSFMNSSRTCYEEERSNMGTWASSSSSSSLRIWKRFLEGGAAGSGESESSSLPSCCCCCSSCSCKTFLSNRADIAVLWQSNKAFNLCGCGWM